MKQLFLLLSIIFLFSGCSTKEANINNSELEALYVQLQEKMEIINDLEKRLIDTETALQNMEVDLYYSNDKA